LARGCNVFWIRKPSQAQVLSVRENLPDLGIVEQHLQVVERKRSDVGGKPVLYR